METHAVDVLPDRVSCVGGGVVDEWERIENNVSNLESAEAPGHPWLPVGLVPWRGPATERAPDEVMVLSVPGSRGPAPVEAAARLSQVAVLKADFTAMVAHELSSPIATIRALVAMVATGELPSEEQRQALATIEAQTDVLNTLVADLQAAAAAERDEFAVRLRPVPLGELLTAAAAFARTLPGAHPLTTQMSGPEWVLADRERIGQVLRNLIENAAKYSLIGAPVELRATAQGSWMRIEVADRGRGIPPIDRRRIFEKFERGRDERGARVPGVGLGLYLSRRLVQLHGSALTVAPRPGGGSSFAFALERLR